jgi:hypothetical protein
MPQFKVIEGKLSRNYNYYLDYTFESCKATDTRMMGVVALKVTWRSREDRRNKLIQIIHLDFSEYGIDDYSEYFVQKEYPEGPSGDWREYRRESDVKFEWLRMMGHLGGQEVSIPLDAMIYLIDSALETNELHYMDHPDYIREFREDTLRKIGFMKEACAAEYERVIRHSPRECLSMVSDGPFSSYATIHYFIMRMIDLDVEAASLLSVINKEELKKSPLLSRGMMSLMRNTVNEEIRLADSTVYKCTAICMSDKSYAHIKLDITLEGRRDTKNRKVTGAEVHMINDISSFEAALHLKHREYITAFKVTCDPDEFDIEDSPMGVKTSMMPVPNGALYMLYNKDNSHIESPDYHLNKDMYGAYLLTPKGELILMSHDLVKINVMEIDLMTSFLTNKLELMGRYKLESQVFQTFSEMQGALFEEVIFTPEDDE